MLAFSQIYADDVTNQMIFSLNVYCDHYQLGCKWKGHLKKLEVCPVECDNRYIETDFLFFFIMFTPFFSPGPTNCIRAKPAKAGRGPKFLLTINFNSVAN